MNLGVPEIVLIVVVALLFFGPSRLPSLGKSIGEAIRGFKKGISGDEKLEDKNHQESLTQNKNEKLSTSVKEKDSEKV